MNDQIGIHSKNNFVFLQHITHVYLFWWWKRKSMTSNLSWSLILLQISFPLFGLTLVCNTKMSCLMRNPIKHISYIKIMDCSRILKLWCLRFCFDTNIDQYNNGMILYGLRIIFQSFKISITSILNSFYKVHIPQKWRDFTKRSLKL